MRKLSLQEGQEGTKSSKIWYEAEEWEIWIVRLKALEEDRARADTQAAGGLFGLCISTSKQEGVQVQGG